ncbi:dockerin type I domain-containing protein [Paenibacillus xylanexedens]|uniref:dockerin type I domain-containing protein n=1 Tax=Paenibacillus xylanexedens TaxID=528191 RepID=UPI001643C165|nr:dockerin type I domain-containing protein [Paenibacillus xylanexedens]
MKGKTDKKPLAPLMRKSMLTVLGLSIALPLGGSLPQATADAGHEQVYIKGPVLNDRIVWLNDSSDNLDAELANIFVNQSEVSIDLSQHFPAHFFKDISASSDNPQVAQAYVSDNRLYVVPAKAGTVSIKLTARHVVSDEEVSDYIKLYVDKQGDVNNDGKVNSSDAVEIIQHIRNDVPQFSGISNLRLNRLDVDRDGEVQWSDVRTLMEKYTIKQLGAENKNVVLTFEQATDAPYALNGKIVGDLNVGSVLNSWFEYYDFDNPNDIPGNTIYQWYRSSDADGLNKTAISQATTSNYTITSEDENKYIYLEVTPFTSYGRQGKKLLIPAAGSVNKDGLNDFIQSLSPPNGSIGVEVNGTIEATYKKTLNPNVLGEFVIKELSSGDIVANYFIPQDYEIRDNKLLINLKNLLPNTTYSVEIPQNVIYVLNDDDLPTGAVSTGFEPGEVPWTFTTKEGELPPP